MKLKWPPAPPGPFRPGFWDSPLRGPWLTSILGTILLAGVSVVTLTGFLSQAAYEPGLGRNGIVPHALPLTFDWPTHPSWLYAFTQGLHVNIGLAVVPILIAKLWSVMPKLFAYPPVRTPAEGIERLSIGLLVSSAIFQFATGIANFQNWYPFKFNFVIVHYYGAVIFVASLTVHVLVKLPVILRSYRGHGLSLLASSSPEPPDPDGLVARYPAEGTISRRGLIGFAGAGSALLLVANAGQSLGGPFRSVSFLSPRRGTGAGGFQVNKTFAATKIPMTAIGADYRLQLGERTISREELLAMPQSTQSLPIACVEGWSTTQKWTGVRLRDLARLAGVPNPTEVRVVSLQARGVLRETTLTHDQIHDERSLLALRVNGKDLPLDHGFPARIIVPALPGVHNTKWVGTMEFKA